MNCDNPTIATALKLARNEEERAKAATAALLALPDAMGELATHITTCMGNVYVHLPTCRAWRHTRRHLGDDAQRQGRLLTGRNGHPFVHYLWRGFDIVLELDPDGESCRLEPTGTITKVQTTYKVVCN